MKIYLSKYQIEKHANKVAHQIEKDYTIRSLHKGKEPRALVLVGVMDGAMPFLYAVAQRIPKDINVIIDTVKCSSYTAPFISGRVKVKKMPDHNLSGCHIVILDDIIDTGKTMTKLVKKFKWRYPKSIIQTGALLKRKHSEFQANYIGGIAGKDLWLVGYGLDDNGTKRNLTDIYVK
jgi:hypoxanthine phosphoribosyltransferase